MTDQLPGEQVQTPPQQPQATTDYEARYKGMVPVVEKLTLENRQLKEQLATAISEREQLSGQLTLKDTEKTVAVGERDKIVQQLTEAKSQTEAELKRLKALELKVKVANKLQSPDLISIVDSIPSVEDEEALTSLMQNITNWGSTLVKEREKELLAGVTPPVTTADVTPSLPASTDEWVRYVAQVEPGEEKNKRYELWRQWEISQHK